MQSFKILKEKLKKLSYHFQLFKCLRFTLHKFLRERYYGRITLFINFTFAGPRLANSIQINRAFCAKVTIEVKECINSIMKAS